MVELVTKMNAQHYLWGERCDGWRPVKSPSSVPFKLDGSYGAGQSSDAFTFGYNLLLAGFYTLLNLSKELHQRQSGGIQNH